MTNVLKFSPVNAKLKDLVAYATKFLNLKKKAKVISFSLPSGFTCPGAKECLSKANKETGKIQDGKDTVFRCFQASAEATYPSLRNMVWGNFDLIRKEKGSVEDLALVINEQLPTKKGRPLELDFDVMRVHVGGDFFSQKYFDAWMMIAQWYPEKIFYAYTKSLHFWRTYEQNKDGSRGYGRNFAEQRREIPKNFSLTASRGGKFDHLINKEGYKEAVVVYSEEEAKKKHLEIDHDDSHAAFGIDNFALLIHGTQPKGSDASAALQKLRKKGKGGYSKKVKKKKDSAKHSSEAATFGAPAAGFNYEMEVL